MTTTKRLRTLALLSLSLATASTASAQPAPNAGDPVPDPGKSIVSDDDSSAIAVNPANLAFMPGSELRWSWVRTGSASPLPARGHSIGFGVPFLGLATGLRVDLLDPPEGAGIPFDGNYHWVRWGLAARAGHVIALGTTFGWGGSSRPALDGFFSVTTGLTIRPVEWISLAAEAKDFNVPESKAHNTIERSWVFGLGLRPTGGRALEIDGEAKFYETSKEWVPRFVAGLDVPRLGRLRGDLSVFDPGGSPKILATAGLDLNLGYAQVSGGGVFGSEVTRSGTGAYAGAAIRSFREPGVRLPAKVVKLRFDDTPGVRGHTHLLRRLWHIAEDPEIEGVVLVIRSEPAASLAHAEEVADAIRGLRQAGKKVLCHLEDAAGRSLYVCSQADRIAMNPAGGLRFAGLSSSYYYLGGLLKKLDVKADFVRIGAHKLAAEQLTMEHGSDVAAQDHQELVDEFEKIYLRDVSAGRKMSPEELKRRIAKGPFVATEARDAGFVDVLAYQDEIDKVVEEMMGRQARVVDDEPAPRAPAHWGDAPKVAVIYLNGDMVDGESMHVPFLPIRLAGSETISRAIRRAKEDPTVKAIVFRIETGGGSSLAADVILREAILAGRVKPFIVSMGSTAASGGYYASVAGREIFALPGTVTGSIGIFYGKVDVSGLLDKLGVHFDSFRSAPRADAESFFRPFTDDERTELGNKVKQFYDTFIGRVAEGRKMKPEDVDAIARGKVWTGEQASKRGLVDHLGGLREALEEARNLGHLADDAPIIELPEEDDSVLGFLLNLVGIKAAGIMPGASLVIPPAFMQMARVLSPFLVYAPDRPLAHAEFTEDEALVDDSQSRFRVAE